jgi:exo-1,4-beta-D-glucosaminidase
MVRAISALTLCLLAFHVFAVAEDPGKVELSQNWALTSAKDLKADGASVSQPGYLMKGWHPIHRMPATVLEILQEDGVYPDLYVGKNMLEKVPQDLYKQDWWYRTEFTAPAGFSNYTLDFPGINYRAEIWINGQKVADSKQIVGMYVAHQLNVTKWLRPGLPNALAVKVTPEQLIQDASGVELADSWFDWINWKYLGYKGEFAKPHQFGVSFVPDRNAGIWKPVYLRATGEVAVENPMVNTDLTLPKAIARLSVYANLHSFSEQPVSGTLKGTISRHGKPTITLEQSVTLSPGETREVLFAPEKYPNLIVENPELWWPYTMGDPALYDLHLEFVAAQKLSDRAHIRFGIRSVTQHRDQEFPDKGKGGNFYLQVNGRDFLVRGADYTPDLLYKYDPDREAAILRYVKDLGLNMLRSESKISSEHLAALADEQGIPLVFGWMCCNQWEKWDQWSEEDHRVAPESLRSQILMLRPHASSFMWANGSDGLPPESIRGEYHRILSELHWQSAIVDTVSSFAKDDKGERIWDGIKMEGPYSWRPPTYWMSGKYPPTSGSSAEQGDNEHIPTLESLKKFISADKLWPINDTWFFHAGSIQNSNELVNIQRAVNRRYGPSSNVDEFVRKAQLAHYENTRAQFEDFAANGWANHKMTMYWMLNSHWPSFYGNLIDYYLSPGGAYFGAKKGLQPLSVVFNSYASGDRNEGKVIVVNQTSGGVQALHVRVRVYDLSGKIIDDRSVEGIKLSYNSASQVLSLPRYPQASPVFFVRCQLFDEQGRVAVDNTYWQSQIDDDMGDAKNDDSFDLKQISWADMTALNTMPRVQLEVSAEKTVHYSDRVNIIRLHNPTSHIAFFERASISSVRDGNEILPAEYDDNYVTVYPGETVEIHGLLSVDSDPQWVKLEGFNTPATFAEIE